MTGPQSPSPERAKYTPNQVPRRNAVYAALSGLRMLGFAFFPRPLAWASAPESATDRRGGSSLQVNVT
jgi:hypothetical protein